MPFSLEAERIPVFPLRTVLFPGGLLPLKVFEQRYLEMAKGCLRDDKPLGVCLIREGSEVGAPAVPEEVGCLARITDWDMPQLGVLHVKTVGLQRFRILSREVAELGLVVAEIERIPPEPSMPLPERFKPSALVLEAIVRGAGEALFPQPFRFEDSTWVGYRLAEVLPLKPIARQKMLELSDSQARLEVLQRFMREQGLIR